MTASKRVLVVDDEEGIREVVDMILSAEGYEVVAAADGAAALAAAGERPPDVVLLDMRMPGMDGWQFAEAYRQAPGRHAPIVVMTAAQDAASRASEVAADGCLAKPFDLDELVRTVERFASPA